MVQNSLPRLGADIMPCNVLPSWGNSAYAVPDCRFGGGPVAGGLSLASWRGVVRDDAGKPVGTATVKLRSVAGERHYTASTSADGAFAFAEIVAGEYELSVESGGKSWGTVKPVVIVFKDGAGLTSGLQLSSLAAEVRLLPGARSDFSAGQRRRASFQRRGFESCR